jgi:small-conductance mechanosensitive channel
MNLQAIMEYSFWGNTVACYSMSAGIFIGSLLIIIAVRHIIISRLKRIAKRTASTFDDVLIGGIEKNALPFLAVGAAYVSLQSMYINPSVGRFMHVVISVLMIFFAVRFLILLLTYGIEKQWKRPEASDSQRQFLRIAGTGIQTVIWGIALILFLDNIGIKISSLVAGLGIGGIAVALAAQVILGDVFAYFMILSDRPFEIGDFIIVNEYLGTIEHIGIKSTRIRSLSGELLVFRNTDLTASRIRNYKKMEQRRVPFTFGVTYGTGLDRLIKIPGIVASIVSSIPNTRFDRAHFKEFGDFSLVYEVVYYVLSADYNQYMDIQQEINFKIREEFDKLGIEFAFPTNTVYLARAGDSASAEKQPFQPSG